MIGCHIVEIDTREELDRALDEPVAMVVLLGKQEHLSAVRLEEIASVCKPRGIPILVDAASEHIERPSPWLQRGADLVVYSGGKFLRGPQTSGLLLGDKGLCQAAWRNGSPHQALGRPMKVSKEDIVGVVAALEYWFGERDEAAERRKWDADLATIAERLGAARRRARRGAGAERGRQGAAAQDRLGPRTLSARRHRAARRGARRRAAGDARRQQRDRRIRSRSTRSSCSPARRRRSATRSSRRCARR